MSKIKVLVVDDSSFFQKLYKTTLNSDAELEVIATAADPYEAQEIIAQNKPDVITLDIEMPRMDGLTFLKKIMAENPIPVVMSSSLTQRGADATIQALESGAIDYIPKATDANFDAEQLKSELIRKVKNAAKVNLSSVKPANPTAEPVKNANVSSHEFRQNILVALGASTGGVDAIKEVLTKLPANFPPVVITQHMPANFTNSFAERLNSLCNIKVQEAADNMPIEYGNAYVAKGGLHLTVERSVSGLICRVSDGENVTGHKPSVDVLFTSVSKNLGKEMVGVILTGMGKDGTEGMLQMKQSGSYNFGQDEKSSIVYGMPKEAFLAGAVDKQLPITQIADGLIKYCSKK